MKAAETSMQKLMNSALQFVVPIYQRTYSWTLKQCNQLWKDILSITRSDDSKVHFIGSVVYIDLGSPLGRPQQLLLIDGQQRITTLSLLLCALARHIEDNNQSDKLNPNKIKNYFLLNNDESGDDKYKLLLTEQDRDTFIRILRQTEGTANNPSLRIIENFKHFQKLIAECSEQVDVIFEGINRLMLVAVALDKSHDNPQLIFESMNSTGKDLSQADLIRNYVLMGLPTDEQTLLYTTYWRPMEQLFGQQGYSDYFDGFMRDYLTCHEKNGRICKISEVYETFKSYHTDKALLAGELLKSIFAFSKYYTAIHMGKDDDSDLKSLWSQLRILDVTVSYPFFMNVYNDYEAGLISKSEFIVIIKTTISYIVRRVICEVPTNSLNKTFATFYGRIKKENYLESVLAEYVSKDSYRAFPTDDEVRERLLTKDVYHLRIKNYILECLENHAHKEKISIIGNRLTIEHIMPQNPDLNAAWRDMLGENWKEIQSKYLHTIGNLTLTRYNSELSDRPFSEKQIIFADSHLRLNNMLSGVSAWNEAEILERTRMLANQIISIWEYPSVSEQVVTDYVRRVYDRQEYTSMEHYANMQPEIKAIYETLDRMIMALDSGIRREYKKDYIAYKAESNFTDIEPYKGHIKLWVNMAYEEIDDPRGLFKDVTNVGHMGNGDAEIKIDNTDVLDYVLGVIEQSLNFQLA